MTLDKFIEGLQIMKPYYDKPDGYHLGAEHDQIYIYATDRALPESDVKRLIELQFFQPDVDGDDDFTFENYDPTEGWSVSV